MSTNRDKVQKDYDDCSSQISNQSRTISLAVLALVWIFIAAKEKPILPNQPQQWLILLAGTSCILSLLCDYFQYLFGMFSSNRLLRLADETGKSDLEYDYDWWQYKWRSRMFYAKQVCAILAAFILIIAILCTLQQT